MLKTNQKIAKRGLDITLSALGILLFWWLLVALSIISYFNTKNTGIIAQKRIGYQGKPFTMYKIRTMKDLKGITTSITVKHDPRVTRFGAFLRATKLDELPQLFNVLIGNMSLVGPRPDVTGFADKLTGEDKIITSVKPGITGPASLYYRNEEEILAQQSNPEKYNREVIWPKKVKINKQYIQNFSLLKDIEYIIQTLFKL